MGKTNHIQNHNSQSHISNHFYVTIILSTIQYKGALSDFFPLWSAARYKSGLYTDTYGSRFYRLKWFYDIILIKTTATFPN